jgi:hypothetical protein
MQSLVSIRERTRTTQQSTAPPAENHQIVFSARETKWTGNHQARTASSPFVVGMTIGHYFGDV